MRLRHTAFVWVSFSRKKRFAERLNQNRMRCKEEALLLPLKPRVLDVRRFVRGVLERWFHHRVANLKKKDRKKTPVCFGVKKDTGVCVLVFWRSISVMRDRRDDEGKGGLVSERWPWFESAESWRSGEVSRPCCSSEACWLGETRGRIWAMRHQELRIWATGSAAELWIVNNVNFRNW